MVDRFMNSLEHMKLAVFHELQDAIRIRRINTELLEHLCSSIRWLLRYATKNGIHLPDVDKLEEILNKAEDIDDKTPA
jgi:hypothetical protein